MFKLSSRGDYGLMLLNHLAKLGPGQYASLSSIARQRHLPLKYLEQLAADLLAAKILLGKEGKGGGYALAKPATKLKLVSILQALEGRLEPVDCDQSCRHCERQAACEQKTGWRQLHAKFYKLLAGYTLADMMANSKIINH
jgi:Rrf2 family protein